ncbi:YfhO family protein [Marinilactibacillus psychrotolerans]|uniref:YfhO family protein n=1 Tax=Marinilactibacillus psychrotolerans TaxID=191770 RepID=UPI003889FF18
MISAGQIDRRIISKQTLGLYSLLFVLMMSAIFGYYFFAANASFIWTTDGYTQHYLIFHDYLEKLRGFFTGSGFPLWDWSIGMGSDVIQSYGYYVIGDPFVYLGLLFPESMTEIAFHLLIILRVWAVGGSFLLFAKKMNFSHYAGLTGSILYAFANYGIFNMSRHPFFILAMIWFPLLCLGMEKIFLKERSTVFTVAVALSAFSNFYFFYKLTILIFLYAITRYFMVYKKEQEGSLLNLFLKTTLAYLIGLMISAMLFVPVVYGFLNASRTPGGIEMNMWIYPLEYYLALFDHTVVPGSYFWTIGGFSLLSFIALVSLKPLPKFKFIKVMLSLLFILLLFPFFGSLMNGLSGPYNRFSFVFAFYLALAGGYLVDQVKNLKPAAKKKSFFLLSIYTAAAVIAILFPDYLTVYMIVPIFFGWAMWFVLFSTYFSHSGKKNQIILGLVILNLVANGVGYYYSFGGNMISKVLDYGTVEQKYQEALGGLEKTRTIENQDISRVGVTSQDNRIRNQFIYLDTMGLNSYLSVSNGNLSEFARAIETSPYQTIQPLRGGVDDRSGVNNFLGVKSIIAKRQDKAFIPFGYDITNKPDNNQKFILAETENDFPFAYTINRGMSRSSFMELNALERETVLSNNIILEDEQYEEHNLVPADRQTEIEEVPFKQVISDKTPVIQADQMYTTESDEMTVKLMIDRPEELMGSELYVRLEGLNYSPIKENPLLRQPTNYTLNAAYGDINKNVYQADRYSFSSYFHRDSMLINLGYVEENSNVDNQVTLNFNRAGRYEIHSIKLYAKAIDEAQISEASVIRNEKALKMTTFDDQKIEGTIEDTTDKWLVTTVPYSKGWKAEINGKTVEPVKANIGFTGLPLFEGENHISMTYQMPYLKTGFIISVLGIIILGLSHFVLQKDKQ